jgi:hypothetical protein
MVSLRKRQLRNLPGSYRLDVVPFLYFEKGILGQVLLHPGLFWSPKLYLPLHNRFRAMLEKNS